MIDFRELVKAGVHFGHQRARGCPKMFRWIWGHKNGVHLIDVSKTAYQLEQAAQFLKGVAAQGKTILWVGTKKSAQDIIAQAGKELDMPSVSHRWIGGTLSNFSQVKKSVTKMLHLEDVLSKAEDHFYTKKELNTIYKTAERLRKNVGGIRELTWPIGAVVLVDVRKERSALREAVRMGVPVVALVDTNSDPSMVDYVIPGNDDAPRSIKLVVDYLVDAVKQGKAEYDKKREEEKAAKAAEAVKRKEKLAEAKKAETKKKEKVAATENKIEAVPKKDEAKKKPAVKKTESKAETQKAVKADKVEAKKTTEKAEAKKKPAVKKTVKKESKKVSH